MGMDLCVYMKRRLLVVKPQQKSQNEEAEPQHRHSTGLTRAGSLFTQQALEERQDDTTEGSQVKHTHPFPIILE